MLHKLSPKLGHALYFPPQPGMRIGEVVIGRYVRFWKAYDFKHVELNPFLVQVTCRADKDRRVPLPKTKDGFPCQVDAIFTVEIGETLADMEKATHQAAAGNDVDLIVRHEDFIKDLLPDFRAVLNAALEKTHLLRGEAAGTDVSEGNLDGNSIENAKAVIRAASSDALVARGFRLRDFQLELEPMEPDRAERAAIPKLEKAWQRFALELENVKQADKKREDEAAIRVEVQREQQVIDRDREVGEQQDKAKEEKGKRDELRERAELVRFEALATIRQDRTQAEARDKEAREKLKKLSEQQIRQLELIEAQEKAKHQQALRVIEIQTEQDQTDKTQQLEAIKRKRESGARTAELAELQEKELANQKKHALGIAQANRDSEEEARRRKEELDQLKHEPEAAKYRTQLAEESAKLVSLKKTEIESIGEAEAKVANAKAIAEHAHLVHMHDRLMQALPQVLEKASMAGNGVGEVRVFYIGGSGAQGDSGAQSGVGQELRSLLSSLSSVSVLREMLRFVGDLPGLVDQPSRNPGSGRSDKESELKITPKPQSGTGV